MSPAVEPFRGELVSLTLPAEAQQMPLPVIARDTGGTETSSTPAARYVTLGCKVNQYETEYVRQLLQANGYRDARPGERAALAVVNTCTVTAESDRKSRHLIRQLWRGDPGVRIIVMGCYATADPVTVARLPGVAAVITDKRELARALEPFGVRNRIDGLARFEGRHRAYVKVQDGCVLDCTFCIIPTVRPGLASRPAEEVVREVERLVDAGHREIVLCGIHLGHYGVDASRGRRRPEWFRLWHLLDRLARLAGEFRIRLSSLEVAEVTDEFVGVLAEHQDRICPHLHLSLQSGSDRILERMRRRYRVSRFLERCERLRQRLDEPAFTTDVIVGFPGETEEDFTQTIATARAAGFSKIHIFPFSPRRGTSAAAMSDPVAPRVIKERGERLAEVEAELAGQYHHRLLGRRLTMLIETPDVEVHGTMRGTACRYVPLRLATIPALAGRLVPVWARAVRAGVIDVEPVAGPDATYHMVCEWEGRTGGTP